MNRTLFQAEEQTLEASIGRLGVWQMLLYLIASVPLTPLAGYVVMRLWTWFIVPLGVMPIGWVHALGLGLIVGFMTTTYNGTTKPVKSAVDFLITRYFVFGFMLLEGWIIQKFM